MTMINMTYLGALRGGGVLTCRGEALARADYDFDGFLGKSGQATGSGEIRTSHAALQKVFGRNDLQLQTDDGRLLKIRFSEKKLPFASVVAHVDVMGELPASLQRWGH